VHISEFYPKFVRHQLIYFVDGYLATSYAWLNVTVDRVLIIDVCGVATIVVRYKHAMVVFLIYNRVRQCYYHHHRVRAVMYLTVSHVANWLIADGKRLSEKMCAYRCKIKVLTPMQFYNLFFQRCSSKNNKSDKKKAANRRYRHLAER
jgi:hypothetical protein